MQKNIVLCSDGTDNTFHEKTTNVSRMVYYLDLSDHQRQMVVYDNGVGTSTKRISKADLNRSVGAEDPHAFQYIEANSSLSSGLPARLRGLAFGYGLKENVKELYLELCNRYRPGDRVFLFGFSRGAFTVRALAGLLYRCQLPVAEPETFDARFSEAWKLFSLKNEDKAATAKFRDTQRPCPIHFLGLWDTVKSYGGIRPIALPHLRHNPIVLHVRHAVALDEERPWFKPTTWGRLDMDQRGAMTKLSQQDRKLVDAQDIKEVWFAGCHSDVGGDAADNPSARIALRWMLGEAAQIDNGVLLNPAGIKLLGEQDPAPLIHQSHSLAWRIVEQIPRLEIDNSGVYPRKKMAWGSSGKRNPCDVQRNQKVYLHPTAAEYSQAIPCAKLLIPGMSPVDESG